MSTVICPPGTTTVPTVVNGDILQFVSGNQTMLNGYDQSALTVGLDGVYFGKSAAVNFPVTTPLKADVDANSTSLVKYAQSGGEVYMQPGGGSALVRRVKHVGPAFFGLVVGGTVTNYEHVNGRLLCAGQVVLTNFYGIGGSATILYNSTVHTLFQNTGAVVTCERGVTTANLYGGQTTFFWQNPSTSLPGATTITCTGGTHKWMLGDITTLNLWGPNAVFDVSNVTQAITIGTLNIDTLAYRNPANKQLLGRDFTVTKTTVNLKGDDGDTVA